MGNPSPKKFQFRQFPHLEPMMLQKLILRIWLLALVASAGWLLWRHGELREVRQENRRLREQLAGEEPAAVPPRQPAPATTQPGTPPLTPEGRAELLTLRGEVARLLRDLPAASNRLAQTTQPAPASPGSTAEAARQQASGSIGNRPEETEKIHRFGRTGDQIGRLLLAHLEVHDGHLPESLIGWEAASGLDAEAAELLGHLELIPNDPIPPEARAYTFVAREREARQTPDGRWIRGYILADANVLMMSVSPPEEPDWPRFERRQTGVAREQARREADRRRSEAPTP